MPQKTILKRPETGRKAVRETKAELTARIDRILSALDREYGTQYRCYLNHKTPWQLLIAVIMSAQCTDARVNIVTADLFQKYDTLEKFAMADLKELEQDMHSIGFYHMKAKNIIACCRDLVERFGGEVPKTIEELTSLAGVGRKTANVIRGNIYNEPSIVVDTHVKRISRKLGLTKEEDPEKIEYALMKVLPKDHWILWNIHIITLGRTICVARRPKCCECFLLCRLVVYFFAAVPLSAQYDIQKDHTLFGHAFPLAPQFLDNPLLLPCAGLLTLFPWHITSAPLLTNMMGSCHCRRYFYPLLHQVSQS